MLDMARGRYIQDCVTCLISSAHKVQTKMISTISPMEGILS